MDILFFVEILQIITATSILFVWVVRYENIIAEFQQYKLPAWMRDMVGIAFRFVWAYFTYACCIIYSH